MFGKESSSSPRGDHLEEVMSLKTEFAQRIVEFEVVGRDQRPSGGPRAYQRRSWSPLLMIRPHMLVVGAAWRCAL